MSRIAQQINQEFEHGNRALIPFITAGDPDCGTTVQLIRELAEAGADVIELGIPYSDPLADGPVIQEASLRSLQNGFELPQAFEIVSNVRKSGIEIPIILFTYANPVIQYGMESFVRQAANVGANGLIIPDLPMEESAELLAIADAHEIDLIPLVAPTSRERVAAICKNARGFVYCVSSLGVTGERAKFASNLDVFLHTVRDHAQVPVAVGFGVSTPEQANMLADRADAIIIGSAIVRRIGELGKALDAGDHGKAFELRQELLSFVRSCKQAIEGAI
ncbi:tryptophan synthase subunit alpha [Fodinisporobacter ferrooxydans]|uniref:Tryptophan synthase alpha chain n=1 Tax=Fodinisporobacter ferrooxydans TaxID=2901836 RepID=A0ABY4CGR5_9BACL|nr:tryptophan synthase subunit alpha [Alicyclobacillaceae bacterium MYW30-H2]